MSKQTFLLIGFDKKTMKMLKPLLNLPSIDYRFEDKYEKGDDYHLIVLSADLENICQMLSKIKSDKKKKYSNILLYTGVDEELILNCYHQGISDFIDKNLPKSIIKAKLLHYAECKKKRKKSASKIRIGNLTINTKKRKVTRKGLEVNLTKTEYDILSLLTTDMNKI